MQVVPKRSIFTYGSSWNYFIYRKVLYVFRIVVHYVEVVKRILGA